MLKLNLLVLICLLFISGVNAQTQRLVLIEEGTNASCTPCANQNPAFDALLNQNRDKITAIKYHWYFPGYDPMHLHNVVENNGRVAFYGINGVPTAVIDGGIPSGGGFGYPGAPSGFTQALIDQHHAIPSPFGIDIYHYLSPAEDSIHVVMRISAAQNIDGNFRAHIAVIEKTINFATAPGSNGEKTFHDVMKKMLPNHLGTALPTTWEAGDYIILRESWKLANIYDMDELGVVGFIQQNATKNVQQAGNSEPEMFAAFFSTDAAIYGLTNLTTTNCSGIYSPAVTITNYGSSPLTSADIVYSVNGASTETFSWTGNLSFLQTEVVVLPDIIFSVMPQNQLDITLQNPNGSADQYVKNNTIIYNFNSAIATPTEVKLMIKLDDNPEEITWDVKDMNGDVVFSGGPYVNPGMVMNETMNFTSNGCYLFTIYDSGGDGIQAPGFFVLYYGSSSQIISGTAFGSMAKAQFDVGGTVAVPEFEPLTEINIYPNPVLNQGTMEFQLFFSEQADVFLHNQLGQVIKRIGDMQYEPGMHTVTFDVSDLEPGLYIISGRIGNKTLMQKITVIR
ncbi:MAG: T9SS type A sorting domain-containing protein [Bacteroidales bacterium]|nr:T9SS type A sorting domain-containing protein [Bacteroidales bacterium]